MNCEEEILWSSNVSTSQVNSVALLQNSGNFVLVDPLNNMSTIWQSFEHPSDSTIPRTRISENTRTGERVEATSWRSPWDPNFGNFSLGMNSGVIPQVYIWKGCRPYWQSGQWNGQTFIGVQYMYPVVSDGFNLVNNREDLRAWRVKRKEVILLADRSAVYMEELPVFSLDMLANATSQFHEDNKLGQGGFGPFTRFDFHLLITFQILVAEIADSFYGKLEDGKEIAVKRLSKASRQGLEEFMNEVLVITKVQHRNLVRLLRCCVNKDEKMLIYEYMKLGCVSLWFVLTLDQSFLHLIQRNEGHRGILDWIRRSIIIEGVGRGLLYLHKDSRLKIIDRDLKPSNILLDNNFNPKISDFVMARIFGSDQDQADTRRVVGMEVMERRRFIKFRRSIHIESKHENGDQKMHAIGLLCVQEFAEDRPTISSVLVMLTTETTSLPAPLQPAFTERQRVCFFRMRNENRETRFTLNNIRITNLTGR
ncbi:hypothetical protein P3S68_031157 [Capsicum galapagoense]